MRIESFQHIGRRAEQQDAYYISPDQKLFLVCDGVGGMNNGSEASRLAVRIISEYYNSRLDITDKEAFKSMIIESISAINTLIDKNAGTTLVCLYTDGIKSFHCHIGDSKLFYFDEYDGSWSATKDHSIVRELFDAGIIKTEEEILTHPMRNRITKAITPGIMPDQDYLEVEEIKNLNSGDIFALCSDGVLENTTDSAFARIFSEKSSDLQEKVETVRQQCVRQSADNCTLIAIEI